MPQVRQRQPNGREVLPERPPAVAEDKTYIDYKKKTDGGEVVDADDDLRVFLGNWPGDFKYEEYKKDHIKDAIFFDIDKSSNKKTELPHMLPNEKDWGKIKNLYIYNDSHDTCNR